MIDILGRWHAVVKNHDPAARSARIEFTTEIDGIHVNGVDLIHWCDDGRIVDFRAMVRPLKGMQILHQRTGDLLQQMGWVPR
jgi:hypothetical protein